MMAIINWIRRWWKAIPVWEPHEIPKRRKIHHYRYMWLSKTVFWIEDNIFTVVAIIQLLMRIGYIVGLFYYSYQWFGPWFILDIRFYILLSIIVIRFLFNTKKRMEWDKGVELRTQYKNKHADGFMGYLWDNRPVVMWYLCRVMLVIFTLTALFIVKCIYGTQVFFTFDFYYYTFLILFTIFIMERLNYTEYWLFFDFKGSGPIPRGLRKALKLLLFNYYILTNSNKPNFNYKGPPIDPHHTPVEWTMGSWRDSSYNYPKTRYFTIEEEIVTNLAVGFSEKKRCHCCVYVHMGMNKLMRLVGYRAIYFFIFLYKWFKKTDAALIFYKDESVFSEIPRLFFLMYKRIFIKWLIVIVFFFL